MKKHLTFKKNELIGSMFRDAVLVLDDYDSANDDCCKVIDQWYDEERQSYYTPINEKPYSLTYADLIHNFTV